MRVLTRTEYVALVAFGVVESSATLSPVSLSTIWNVPLSPQVFLGISTIVA